MKNAVVLMPVLALLLAFAPLTAEPPHQESNCPAHQAADKGIKLLEELHHVMAPAWHEAYPAKNYAALGEAMIKFDAMIPKVKEFTHTFKTTERQDKFDAARTRFIGLVAKGKSSHDAKANEALYALTPDIHTSFEEMAYYLLPLDFPEYSSLLIVVDLMIDTHLKNEDFKAIVTSMEALKIKNGMLQKATLPEDMKSVEKNVAEDIAAIGAMCRDLEEACGSTSSEIIVECLKKLKIICDKFEQDYI